MKKTLLTLLLLTAFSTAFSQGFAYYPFSSVFSFSSNPTRTIWVDSRFQTNSYFSSLSTEVALMANFNDNPKARFYGGLSSRFNFLVLVNDYRAEVLEGYGLHAGIRSEPFAKLPRLQLAFEISPYVQKDFEIGLMRSYLGIAYYVGR
jgi:hypothetical protein